MELGGENSFASKCTDSGVLVCEGFDSLGEFTYSEETYAQGSGFKWVGYSGPYPPTNNDYNFDTTIKDSGNAVRRHCQKEFSGRSLWAKGYAVTTDLEHMDELVQQLLNQTKRGD